MKIVVFVKYKRLQNNSQECTEKTMNTSILTHYVGTLKYFQHLTIRRYYNLLYFSLLIKGYGICISLEIYDKRVEIFVELYCCHRDQS